MKNLVLFLMLLTSQVFGGGVINGQAVNAAVTNAAYIFKNANDASAFAYTYSYNITASTPVLKVTGTPYTGGTATTTKPSILIEPTGTTSTGWSTGGTYLGINDNGTITTGNFLDFQANATSWFKIDTGGNVTSRGGQFTLGNISAGRIGRVILSDGTTAAVTVQAPTVSSAYNFNLPNGAGSSGQPLLSGGGSSNPNTWNKLGLQYGGTNSDLSATGGASNVLKQVSSGAAVTVAQLACADLSNSANSCSTTAVSTNTASDIVLRDGSGNFAAGTITANLTGTASNATLATTATNATNTAITDDTSTNSTMYPTWVTANTGNLPQKTTSTKLTYNPSTGALGTTTFVGALTGTASGNTTYTANNHGMVISSSTNAMTVVAPDASTTKVWTSGGSSADPSWQAPAVGSTIAITDDTTTNATMYPTWVTTASGNQSIKVASTKLTFNPSTGTLNLGVATSAIGKLTFSGNTSGTITLAPQAAAGTWEWDWPITAGSSGQVLTSQGGAGTAMTWTSPLSNPMTTGGDLIYGGSSGTPTRLANGSAGQILYSNGTTAAPTWTSSTNVISSSCGSYTNSTGSYTDVTNLTVTITADGVNPIWIGMIPDGSGNASVEPSRGSSIVQVDSILKIVKDPSGANTDLALFPLQLRSSSPDIIEYMVPPGSFFTIDTPTSGSHTYKFRAVATTGTIAVSNIKMYAHIIR
jgi:hypothetical protein